VVDYCEKHEIAFIPWFPMAGGDMFKPGNPLDKVAKQHRASISQVALAWLLHRSPCILPIPGTSSIAHLEENTAAASLRISADEWKEIERSA
jgi:aryl-alcohol dehydrogenase-like predicted oxidoreductase